MLKIRASLGGAGVLLWTIFLATLFVAFSIFTWYFVASQDRQQRITTAETTLRYCAEATAQQLENVLSRLDHVVASFSASDISARDRAQLTGKLIRAVGLLPEVSAVTILDPTGRVIGSSQIAGSESRSGEGADLRLLRITLLSSPEHLTLHLVTIQAPASSYVIGTRRIEDARSQLAGLVVLTIRPSALETLTMPSWAPQHLAIDLLFPETTTSDVLGASAIPATLYGRVLHLLATGSTNMQPASIRTTVPLSAYGVRLRATLDLDDKSLDGGLIGQPYLLWLAVSLTSLGLIALLAVVAWASRGTAEVRRVSRLENDLDATREDRDRVLASVGHDVRTSLTSIRGFALLLQESDLRHDQRHWVGMTLASTQSIMDMVGGLLQAATGGEGQRKLLLDEVNIVDLIQGIAGVQESRASEKGLELRVRLATDVSGIWQMDPTRLRQILSNLIDNAIKYTSHGHITISASLLPDTPNDQGTRTVVISVADTGAGIPISDRDRIFDAYQRGSLQAGAKDGGLGLGLAICRENAAVMNGVLKLDSTVGQGTEFTFEFPAAHLRNAPKRSPFRGRVAVVVGFEDTQRRRLARQLEGIGFTVETAADGFVGVGVAERAASGLGTVDLVVVDGSMVLLKTSTFVERLRANRTHELARLVWVGTSGDGGAEAARSYADVFVAPPGGEDEVLSAVLKVMEGLPELALIAGDASKASRGRLLVVEDNKPNQQMLLHFLSSKGFAVFTADNGEDAVRAAAHGKFDAILMDIQLPGIDGYEATKRIRALGGVAATMPILGQTALTGSLLKRKCQDAGMTDVIEKTSEMSQLVDNIDAHIDEARRGLLCPDTTTHLSRSDDHDTLQASVDATQKALQVLAETIGLLETKIYVEAFVSDATSRSKYLLDLIPKWEVEAIERVCYDLASMASNLGLQTFVDALGKVLQAVQHGDSEGARGRAVEAERQSFQLGKMLVAEFNKLLSDKRGSACA